MEEGYAGSTQEKERQCREDGVPDLLINGYLGSIEYVPSMELLVMQATRKTP